MEIRRLTVVLARDLKKNLRMQAMNQDFLADSKVDKPENNLPTSSETLTSDGITTQQIENDTAEIGTVTQAHS